jgi:hypothetical protein
MNRFRPAEGAKVFGEHLSLNPALPPRFERPAQEECRVIADNRSGNLAAATEEPVIGVMAETGIDFLEHLGSSVIG